MTTIELKKELIQKITEINDISFLKAINIILDSKTGEEIISLTREQKNEIIESKKEIKKGLYNEDELFHKEVLKWLREK